MLQDAVRGVRGVLVVAAELAEEAGRRVLDTAGELLKQGGELPPGAEQLRVLAGEAVTAGRAGVDLVAGVARGEVERVFEKVGDQVVKVGVVLSFLESKLREVDEEPEAGTAAEQPVAEPEPAEPDAPPVRPAARAQGLFDAGWDAEPEAPVAPVAEDVAAARRRAAAGAQAGPRRAPARKAAARKGAAAKQASAQRSVPRRAAGAAGAVGTPAEAAAKRPGTAKKAAARKAAPASGRSADGSSAQAQSPSAPLPVKKAPVKRSPGAKKAAPSGRPADGSPARASAADAPSPAKKAAAKKAAAKKTAAKKAPAKRAASGGKAGAEGDGGE